MDREGDEVTGEPLSETELRHLRRIMKSDEHARWLWSSARTWASWITIVIAGIYAAKSAFFDGLIGRK